MNIAIVGTGYVGLVTGACFAKIGVNVHCIDIDAKKIERLQSGYIPIYDLNLDALVLRNAKNGRPHFTADLTSVLDKDLCEKLGADVEMVSRGIGTDSRIGSKFLRAGCGYGGSCFPKDVKALIKTAQNADCELAVLNAVERVNNSQKRILFEKFKSHFCGKIKGIKVAIWGLAFKPETDDMREAASLVLIDDLLAAGCEISVYDPVAMNECRRRLSGKPIRYATDIYDCAKGTQVIFHVTEWKEFRLPDWERIKKSMAEKPVLIDGRNTFANSDLKGITYKRIG